MSWRTLMMMSRLKTVFSHIVKPTQSRCAVSCFNTYAVLQSGGTHPQIIVEPRVALYDEKVKIMLTGLASEEKITLHGQAVQIVKGKDKVLFGSCAQYVADSNGIVDVTLHPSLGGSYTGVEPMGIIWSLHPAPGQPQHTRMSINFTDSPRLIDIHTYRGHLELEDIYQGSGNALENLGSIVLERWFRSPDVTRIEVEVGNVRGALFLPPGDGPFQGVIDMFGSAGGLIEYRSALLASRGFAALSLPFFKYKDLPETLFELTYDYFDEAIEWLSQHPKVCKNGIGVIAVSKGGEFALSMGTFSPKVKAVVAINSLAGIGQADLIFKGKTLLKIGYEFNFSEEHFEDDVIVSRDAVVMHDVIPIWKGTAKFLIFISLDDAQLSPEGMDMLLEKCPEEKKKDIEVVRYPGAGHLLEPPYNALCTIAYNRGIGLKMKFGGKPLEHAKAQEDSWQRILNFLGQNIPS